MDFVTYFFSNPDMWFNPHKKYDDYVRQHYEHLLSSTEIIKNLELNNTPEKLLEFIIIYDQLPYYIYRNNNYIIRSFQKNALIVAKQLIFEDYFYKYSPEEQCFIMLPLRHSNNIYNNYVILNIVKKLRNINDCNIYKRFYKATLIKIGEMLNSVEPYKGSYKDILEDILEDILDISSTYTGIKSIRMIFCDYVKYLEDFYKDYDTVCVSLSGGVDSMVLLHLLNISKKNVIAFHLNYGNRETSDDERDMCIYYCQYFNIPIIVRNITEIKRDRHKDREIYEEVTRRIRFGMYKLIQEKYNNNSNNIIIALGHNKDDCMENIFSNIIKCKKYSNLKGMEYFSEEDYTNGIPINISRPFLNTYKKDIYRMASDYKLPYLYDSTPSWSERGKKRDILFPQLNEFDERILPGMYMLSEYMSSVMNIYNKSISENYTIINKNTIHIKNIYDHNHLSSTLTMICQELKIPYFSKKSIENLYKYHKDGRKIIMNNEYYFYNNCLFKK
jgi:tRNA(Ile)-lysidine synthetase-like protein